VSLTGELYKALVREGGIHKLIRVLPLEPRERLHKVAMPCTPLSENKNAIPAPYRRSNLSNVEPPSIRLHESEWEQTRGGWLLLHLAGGETPRPGLSPECPRGQLICADLRVCDKQYLFDPPHSALQKPQDAKPEKVSPKATEQENRRARLFGGDQIVPGEAVGTRPHRLRPPTRSILSQKRRGVHCPAQCSTSSRQLSKASRQPDGEID
jgi:hypothetical protein